MFLQRHFIFFLTTINSGALAAIHDEEYLSKNGPFGLMTFTKNDTFVDWVRVPEVNYKQWIYALKVWRNCSIVVGILCLIFAALVLAYIIHGFHTNSAGPFSCFGDVKPDDGLSDANLPANLQQFALSHQLKIAQQREQEAQRQKYEAERRLSAILRNPPSSAIFTNQFPLKN